MVLHAPQIIYLLIWFFVLAHSMANHGKTAKVEYNFWIGIVRFFLICVLLSWGGFFG